MEVPCCPKCAKDSHAKIRSNDPMVAFYTEQMEIRVCLSCGQIYCMTWIQWLLIVILTSILLGVLPVIFEDGILSGIFALGIVALVEPIIFDVVQTYFPWKSIDEAYLNDTQRWSCTIMIVNLGIYFGRYLVMALLL